MNHMCQKVLYLLLVRPILEFGSIVWNPRQIDLIDKLHRHFIRMIAFKLNSWDVLIIEVKKQCKIPSLSMIDVILMIIYFYTKY
jgi:hypothetical protein